MAQFALLPGSQTPASGGRQSNHPGAGTVNAILNAGGRVTFGAPIQRGAVHLGDSMGNQKNILEFIEGLLAKRDPSAATRYREFVKNEQSKPLIVVFVGQTGTGKTSLVNATCRTNFEISHTRPCTKRPQIHKTYLTVAGRLQEVIIVDLPGFGESPEADQVYLEIYLEHLRACDFAIWAFPAGTRSFEYDRFALKQLLSRLESDQERSSILNKIQFVLTKADAIVIEPWNLIMKNDEQIVARPAPATCKVLLEQSVFAWHSMLEPLGSLVTLRHPLKNPVEPSSEGPLRITRHSIEHRGTLSSVQAKALQRQFPNLSDAIDNLYKEQRATVCSARLRFNLDELLMRVFLQAPEGGIYRLNGINGADLLYLHPSLVPSLSNVRLAYPDQGKLIELSTELLWQAQSAAAHHVE
jgi:GTP-binding protein EngB required for normal cell division